MKFGIYRLHEPLEESELKSIEDAYGTAIHIISVYRAWNKCSVEDDILWLRRIKSSTRQILLTWEPWSFPINAERPFDQPDFSLKKVISGTYDYYIKSFAGELAKSPFPVYLRIMHEMNGNWYPWCGTVNNNSPDDYIAAWNHIQKVVNKNAPSKIQWVWSPYAFSYPQSRSNRIEKYFPGDNAIDWIAIDGYNWGTSKDWSEWMGFREIFSDSYNTLTFLSQRPIMIGEMACAETGGSKALWIKEAFDALQNNFSRINALIWFDINKECDWRIASSPEALSAFQSSASSLKLHRNIV